ncbi:c-type cytochrome [Arenimonas alkanexedens]
MGFMKSALVILGLGAAAVAGGVYFGAVHPGADEPHSTPVFRLIETARDRAIAVRSRDIVVPTLGSQEQIRSGAGNYAAMCTTCHLAPGMAPTELSQGLYPLPPALTRLGAPDPARAFWVIKHGIKASGMPAWGRSMSDEYIWNMVAFLQQAPVMSPAQYQDLVASSDGHSHGGGESMPHDEKMPGMPTMTSDHHGGVDVAPHDDAGSPPHDHGAPTPAPEAHDDSGTAPHEHAPATESADEHHGH